MASSDVDLDQIDEEHSPVVEDTFACYAMALLIGAIVILTLMLFVHHSGYVEGVKAGALSERELWEDRILNRPDEIAVIRSRIIAQRAEYTVLNNRGR